MGSSASFCEGVQSAILGSGGLKKTLSCLPVLLENNQRKFQRVLLASSASFCEETQSQILGSGIAWNNVLCTASSWFQISLQAQQGVKAHFLAFGLFSLKFYLKQSKQQSFVSASVLLENKERKFQRVLSGLWSVLSEVLSLNQSKQRSFVSDSVLIEIIKGNSRESRWRFCE